MTSDNTDPARRRSGPLRPNPALWAALEQGAGLRRILEDFYGRVYEDLLLAHFFHGVTKERAIDKQYSFLMEIFTGERVYFGDRPRNAHHWMVISDALFDHREALMEQCLRRAGLADHHVKAWLAVEGVFRKQIVKEAPVARRMGGLELPLDGWEDVKLTSGGVCDGCARVIDIGATARAHVRTGRTLCAACPHENAA
ncbi:MAG: group 1 truncated hemoglobin [Deltaproteobacteria bacterium]|nr:group 1 truncated hemoglobin [Deltaproteobacteria bacterium]